MNSTLMSLAGLAVVAMLSTGCGSSGNAAADSGGNGGNGGSKDSTTRQQAVKFSDCMRTNGVSAFPDPDASGELTVDGVANNSRIDTSGAAWKKAIAACKDLEPSGFTGTKRTAAQQAAALEFAQCIRENGVDDFPDPDPNGPMIDTNRIPSLSGENADLSELNAAMKTCGDIHAGRAGITK